MQRRRRFVVLLAAISLLSVGLVGGAAADPDGQHGVDDGHLIGTGEWGKITLVDELRLTETEGLVADVAVSPDGNYAFLANWGEPDCAGPEAGGINNPDAGAWVVDISGVDRTGDDFNEAELVGFIPSHQDTRPGEGMQVVEINTSHFSGNILVMNNEACGPQYRGGMTLWDVTDPLKPKRLGTSWGDRAPGLPDANQIHSAFAWQAGDKAYAVIVDNREWPDVDILDITNPRRPTLIAEYDLREFGVSQPELGLGDSTSFLHDMVVKEIDGSFIMLASYWDGGYVLLDVTDPADAQFIGDTDYEAIDPLLFERTGAQLTPEGNAHQAEFTLDNRFFIGTDEDFAPYRTDEFKITSGDHQGTYPSGIVGGGQAPGILPDLTLDGPVVYGGYGCPDSEPVPTPESIPGYLESLAEGQEKIAVLQRGPVGDPSAPEPACFPGQKAHEAVEAGWDAVVFVNHHAGDAAGGDPFCGSGAFVDEVVAICVSHETFHLLFDLAPLDPSGWSYPEDIELGTVGAEIEVGSLFDGWGYVHLFDATTLEGLDQFAIDEAHDTEHAFGFGDLTVHEVATDPQDASLAYLSYYAGGLRAIQIVCENEEDTSTCELEEVGGYLDEDGNNFWGVEAFVGEDGNTYILGSDRDHGLWIFRDP
ncbi:MAG: hypothetical protein GEU78_16060 [Actinobacteria bacterium]|nr:hypothetical protein [Actinomycetota bacterium]